MRPPSPRSVSVGSSIGMVSSDAHAGLGTRSELDAPAIVRDRARACRASPTPPAAGVRRKRSMSKPMPVVGDRERRFAGDDRELDVDAAGACVLHDVRERS
jgi:hypothetical protein